MMRALTTSGAGMIAQQYNLDTIANNLANVNTTAFRGQRAEFQDLMYQTLRASGTLTQGSAQQPSSVQVGLGTRFAGHAISLNQGAMQATNSPLDLSISGQGFFQVELPDGRTAYTRDGSFKLDSNGLMVTADGYAIVPNVTIPPGSRAVSISQTGIVSAIPPGANEPTEIITLTLALFPNETGLSRIGQNLFEGGGASGEPSIIEPGGQGSGLIQSGFLEGSNVQIVEEMVRMIMAQRAYEINSKGVMTADEMLSTLNTLKR